MGEILQLATTNAPNNGERGQKFVQEQVRSRFADIPPSPIRQPPEPTKM